MFDLFAGLPLHPLVVHGIVVLLPLAAAGTVAIAVWPRWRRPYGWLVVGAAGVVVALIPVATESGEALARRVGTPEKHAELAEQLIWFALPLFLVVLALVVLDRRRAPADAPAGSDRPPAPPRSPVMTVLAVLAVVAALAAVVQVVRVGDSGARAAWEDVIHG